MGIKFVRRWEVDVSQSGIMFLRFDVGAEDGIHASQAVFDAGLEPLGNIRIETQMNGGFASWHGDAGGLPEVRAKGLGLGSIKVGGVSGREGTKRCHGCLRSARPRGAGATIHLLEIGDREGAKERIGEANGGRRGEKNGAKEERTCEGGKNGHEAWSKDWGERPTRCERMTAKMRTASEWLA